jgi:hypothetical protein
MATPKKGLKTHIKKVQVTHIDQDADMSSVAKCLHVMFAGDDWSQTSAC